MGSRLFHCVPFGLFWFLFVHFSGHFSLFVLFFPFYLPSTFQSFISTTCRSILLTCFFQQRTQQLRKECRQLTTQLPISRGSSVFVRTHTDRLDVMKAIITGPQGKMTRQALKKGKENRERKRKLKEVFCICENRSDRLDLMKSILTRPQGKTIRRKKTKKRKVTRTRVFEKKRKTKRKKTTKRRKKKMTGAHRHSFYFFSFFLLIFLFFLIPFILIFFQKEPLMDFYLIFFFQLFVFFLSFYFLFFPCFVFNFFFRNPIWLWSIFI